MAKSKQPTNPITIHEIPMRRPPSPSSRDPTKKTLLDLIDERHPSLSKPKITELAGSEAADASSDDEEEDEEIVYEYSRFSEAVYVAVPLAILYTGLDVLCRQQYHQPVEVRKEVMVALRGLPVLFVLNYMFHRYRQQALYRAAFFGAAIAAGMWMVHSTNRSGYYAIMKRAPGVGTLWIWCVVELDAVMALLSCLVVVVFFFLGDYKI